MWILKSTKTLPNGHVTVGYYVAVHDSPLGYFMESDSNIFRAKRFKTKKEAVDALAFTGRKIGKEWEVIKIAS